MKSLPFSTAIVAAALLATAALPSHAAAVSFDFENQPIFTETPFSMASGGVTASFAGPGDVDPGAFGISSNYQTPTGFTYRLMQGDFLTVGSAFGAIGAALTITFSTPQNGFTLDFALDDRLGANSLFFVTDGGGAAGAGGALSSGFLYAEGSLSYSGAAFTTITLRSDADDFQIDNLQATSTAEVPEPASLALLLAGLPLVALSRRRKNGRAA